MQRNVYAALVIDSPSSHRCGICDRIIYSVLNPRARSGSIVKWIAWILERPGHPEYAHVDFASRYGKWHVDGCVGPEPKYVFRVVDRRLVWSSAIAEIRAAREVFEKFISEGMLAYRIRKDGSPGRRIVCFNPSAEEVVFRISENS